MALLITILVAVVAVTILGFGATLIFRTLLDAVPDLKRAIGRESPGAPPERIEAMEAELTELRSELDRLREMAEFNHRLLSGRKDPGPTEDRG